MVECHTQHACGGCTAGEPCYAADNPCEAGQVCAFLNKKDNGDGTGWGQCGASYQCTWPPMADFLWLGGWTMTESHGGKESGGKNKPGDPRVGASIPSDRYGYSKLPGTGGWTKRNKWGFEMSLDFGVRERKDYFGAGRHGHVNWPPRHIDSTKDNPQTFGATSSDRYVSRCGWSHDTPAGDFVVNSETGHALAESFGNCGQPPGALGPLNDYKSIQEHAVFGHWVWADPKLGVHEGCSYDDDGRPYNCEKYDGCRTEFHMKPKTKYKDGVYPKACSHKGGKRVGQGHLPFTDAAAAAAYRGAVNTTRGGYACQPWDAVAYDPKMRERKGPDEAADGMPERHVCQKVCPANEQTRAYTPLEPNDAGSGAALLGKSTEAIQNGPDTPIPQGIFAIEHLASSLCIQLMDGSAGHGKGQDASGHRRRRSARARGRARGRAAKDATSQSCACA